MDMITLETMARGLASFLLVKVTLVVGGAWLAAWGLSSASAATRHAVWGLALGGLLLMPLLLPVVPAWHLGLLPSFEAVGAQQAAIRAVPPSAAVQRARGKPVDGGEERAGGRAAMAEPAAERRATPGWWANPASDRSTDRGGLWMHVAVGIWVLGGLVVAVRLVGGLAWVYRREQQVTALQDADRRRLVRVLGEKIGLQRTVAVVYGPRGEGQTPMGWGILRPTIWLPAEAQSWPAERFRAVLLHELAHVKRGDYLVHLVVQCAQAACWPNPLVWLAGWRLHREQEQACDDVVLQTGMSSHAYAEHLLETVRALRAGGSWRTEGALAMGHQARFKGRMRALLDKDTDRSPLGLRTGLAMSVTGGLFALLVTALNFGMTPDQAGSSAYVWLEAEAGALSAFPGGAAKRTAKRDAAWRKGGSRGGALRRGRSS